MIELEDEQRGDKGTKGEGMRRMGDGGIGSRSETSYAVFTL